MKKTVFTLLLLSALSFSAFCLNGWEICVLGSIGYILNDRQGVNEEGTAVPPYSWEACAQILFPLDNHFRLGLEASMQYLYSYVLDPESYGYTGIGAVTTPGRFSLLAGYDYSDSFSIQAGLGFFFFAFPDFLPPSIFASIIYRIRLTENLFIPLFIRFNVLVSSDLLFPLEAGSGISFRF